MLSKMSAQQQVGGRRPPLSLSGGSPGSAAGGNSGLRSSQQAGNANANTKLTQRGTAAAAVAAEQERKDNVHAKNIAKQQQQPQQQQQNDLSSKPERRESQNGVGKNNSGNDKTQNGTNGNAASTAAIKEKDNKERTTKEKDSKQENVAEKKVNYTERKVKIDMKKGNANDIRSFMEKNIEKQKNEANRMENENDFGQAKKTETEKYIEKANKKDVETKKTEAIANDTIVIQDDDDLPAKPEMVEVEKPKEPKSGNENFMAKVDEPGGLVPELILPQTPERRSTRKTNQKTPQSSAKIVEQPQVQQSPTKANDNVENDVEMETVSVNESPIRAKPNIETVSNVDVNSATANNPTATSTPGKLFSNKPKDEIELAIQGGNSPDRKYYPRTYSQIGGRRSIRQATEYAPLKFYSNPNLRESYRRINTELDVTSNTDTSMNVTVGSEIPNNSSFSFLFFGRSRKRERTPPRDTQSASELHTDVEMSPPKRARIERPGFFSGLIHSPMTALRSAFTKASIQTPSKPLRLEQTQTDDEDDVQNVSGVHVEEDIPAEDGDVANNSAKEDEITFGNENVLEKPKKGSPIKADDNEKSDVEKDECDTEDDLVNESIDVEEEDDDDDEDEDKDIEIKETFADAKKANRCNVM